MEDTYSNLVKENQLLRAQLALVRDRAPRSQALRSEILGARSGDLLFSDENNFDAVVGTVVVPSETAVEIYAGETPLPWLHPNVHVFIEPVRTKADLRAKNNPAGLVLNATARDFLAMAPDSSVDCVVIRDLVYAQASPGSVQTGGVRHVQSHLALERDTSFPLLDQARRVARRQVVALCRHQHECDVSDIPRLFNESNTAFVQHGAAPFDSQCQVDFREGILVVNTGEPRDGVVREFAVVLDAASAKKETSNKIRLVLLSSAPPAHFRWSGNDVIICDVALTEKLADVPAGTIIPVPLTLLRTAMDLPAEILRTSILNFTFLEHYLQCMPAEAVGTDAEFIIAEMQSRPRGRAATY
jgi:hypothetical protein